MKRVYVSWFLVLALLMVSCPVRAVTNSVSCHAGDTIYAVFALADDGDQPDGVMCRLIYDMDVFTVVPGIDLVGADGFSILNGHPAVLLFKVSKYAPAGQYSIEAKVIDATADADGKKFTDVRIAPVQVTVESAATDVPENTPAPTPTGKPLPRASTDSTVKKQVQAGDYVTFGRYPQTAEGNDETPIEWLVLDVQGNKALLLSRYGLDAKPYNTQNTSITWEKCTLRGWLNGEFMEKAFNSAEQKAIMLTNVDNSSSQGYSKWSTSGGNNTQDRVFLLSYAEANKYLGVTYDDTQNTKSRVAPTAYAIKQGTYTNSDNKTVDGSAAGWWWLRSPGRYQDRAARVSTAGSLGSLNVDHDYEAVRPALWVNLDSGIF